jgi:hypothetical protein
MYILRSLYIVFLIKRNFNKYTYECIKGVSKYYMGRVGLIYLGNNYFYYYLFIYWNFLRHWKMYHIRIVLRLIMIDVYCLSIINDKIFQVLLLKAFFNRFFYARFKILINISYTIWNIVMISVVVGTLLSK